MYAPRNPGLIEKVSSCRHQRSTEMDDKFAQDKSELRKEIRAAQGTAFSQISDLEMNFKRQVQQVENQAREMRSQLLDSTRATKEQAEELERQVISYFLVFVPTM
eukprot:SAG31_NODE_1705_length_7491_cov_3.705222_1_plen_105_part_00